MAISFRRGTGASSRSVIVVRRFVQRDQLASDQVIEDRLSVDCMREAVWVAIDFGHGEDGRQVRVRVLVQIRRVVRISVQEVKSQASTLSLEELALAIAPFVALILGVEAGIFLHRKHDKWSLALAGRSREPL